MSFHVLKRLPKLIIEDLHELAKDYFSQRFLEYSYAAKLSAALQKGGEYETDCRG